MDRSAPPGNAIAFSRAARFLAPPAWRRCAAWSEATGGGGGHQDPGTSSVIFRHCGTPPRAAWPLRRLRGADATHKCPSVAMGVLCHTADPGGVTPCRHATTKGGAPEAACHPLRRGQPGPSPKLSWRQVPRDLGSGHRLCSGRSLDGDRFRATPQRRPPHPVLEVVLEISVPLGPHDLWGSLPCSHPREHPPRAPRHSEIPQACALGHCLDCPRWRRRLRRRRLSLAVSRAPRAPGAPRLRGGPESPGPGGESGQRSPEADEGASEIPDAAPRSSDRSP